MTHILERMIKKAQSSPCRYKVAAVAFDKKGSIIAYSNNKKRFNRPGGGVHAEMRLMLQYGVNIKTILICRASKTGILHRMDPCEACARKADELGIRIVSIVD